MDGTPTPEPAPQVYKLTFHASAFAKMLLERKGPTCFEVVDVNDAALRVGSLRTVSRREQLIGRNLFDAFPGLEELGHTHKYHEALDCQTTVSLISLLYEDPEDLEVPEANFDITLTPLAKDTLLLSYASITQQLKETVHALEMANEALELFTYTVSHDLRGPLRAIAGFGEELGLQFRDVLDSRGAHYLQRILANTERMSQLINGSLALARVGSRELSRSEVDLSAKARAIASGLAEEDETRRARWVIADGLRAHADPAMAHTVLENLLGNAFKFSAEMAEAVIEVGVVEDGAFFVRDNGAGLDVAHENQLFQPFQRLHTGENLSGLGLGLATVWRIIRRHRGKIWVTGVPGEGATFFFTLGPR